MLIDHAAVIFLTDHVSGSALIYGIYFAMRLLGRMAFPLYAFLLTEGFSHTRNRKKYAGRLFLLAVISEIPFNLMADRSYLSFSHQNTVWLLLLGFLCLMAHEQLKKAEGTKLIEAAVLLAAVMASVFLRLDYGAEGLLLILVFSLFRGRPDLRTPAVLVVLFFMNPDPYIFGTMFAYFMINHYNGEKGRDLGRLPHFFYPVHIVVLLAAKTLAGYFL